MEMQLNDKIYMTEGQILLTLSIFYLDSETDIKGRRNDAFSLSSCVVPKCYLSASVASE